MKKPSRRISPITSFGRWSVGLIVAMLVFFFLGTSLSSLLYKLTPAGNTIQEDIAARPALALAMLAGMTVGFSAFVSGLLAVFKQKETALLVYAAILMGVLLLLFLVGETVFPH